MPKDVILLNLLRLFSSARQRLFDEARILVSSTFTVDETEFMNWLRGLTNTHIWESLITKSLVVVTIV